MRKRITSITLLLFMTMSIAAPLIPHGDCNMSCCEVVKPTCHNKNIDMQKPKASKMDMKSCSMGSSFVPILSAPLHQFKIKTDLNVTLTIDVRASFRTYTINFNKVLISHPPEPPPSYNLPLLA